MTPAHADMRSIPQTGHDEPAHPEWIDRLVELHVLADHGDTAAAAAASDWIAHDGAARRVWQEVQRTCEQLRQTQPGE